MLEAARLRNRELQYLLGARGVRHLIRGHVALARLYPLLDPAAELLQIHVQVREDRRRHPLALPDQAQQNVLCAHVVMTKTGGLLPSHGEDLAYSIGEIAVHRPSFGWPGSASSNISRISLARSCSLSRLASARPARFSSCAIWVQSSNGFMCFTLISGSSFMLT